MECEKQLLPTLGFVQVWLDNVTMSSGSLLGFSFGLTFPDVPR